VLIDVFDRLIQLGKRAAAIDGEGAACRLAWGRPRLANQRAIARALKLEGSPLMGLT
jgi:hypothetical protein